VATVFTRAAVGGGPIYGQRAFALTTPSDLLAYALLGMVAAGAAMVFSWALRRGERLVEAHPIAQPWRAAVGGLVVGLLAVMWPQVVGNGYEPLNLVLDGRVVGSALAWLLVAKVVATAASVASGVPGGVFTPVLLIGGAVGALSAPAIARLPFIGPLDPGGLALVGMAATTAATIHAPLTAAIMVFELSGDYAIALPLLLSTVVATWVARGLGGESLYQAELRRRGLGWELTLDGRVVRGGGESPTTTRDPE
jgi:CIC family chloride channel protein